MSPKPNLCLLLPAAIRLPSTLPSTYLLPELSLYSLR